MIIHVRTAAVLVAITATPFLAATSQRSDAEVIRAARVAQNRAIVARDVDRVASFWTDDVMIRRGLGQAVIGRTAYRELFEGPVTDSTVIYQRTPADIDVSSRWPLAFETGTWTGRMRDMGGPVVIRGRYSAQWVKREGRWLIRSEVFTALRCFGAGCSWEAAP